MRPERPNLRPKRPELRPERPYGGGRANERTNKVTNEQKSPCVLQNFVPFGATALLPPILNHFLLKQGRGTDDHLLPLGCYYLNYTRRATLLRKTRPDTRPIPVADGWAGAEMRVFTLSNSIITDGRTNGPTDQRTNGRTRPLIMIRGCI